MSVPALCAGVKELKDVGHRCRVRVLPTDTWDTHGKRWTRIASPGFCECWVPFAHHDCSHNEIIAVRNRVVGDVPPPTIQGLEALRKTVVRMKRYLPKIGPDDWYVMPNLYSGAKRAAYMRATDRLLANGVSQKDAEVTMFVKFERLMAKPEKPNPDPRAIQFRRPVYCVALAKYLKPMEHFLYEFSGDGEDFPPTRLIGKGLNQSARAMLLRSKMKRFKRPVVISLDATRFDQHCHAESLKIEHSVYHILCSDPIFIKLLSWQLKNKGRSALGLIYEAWGRRMSGDMNTALGNCILMVLMIATFLFGHLYDMLDDGDDCLVIIEEDDLEWFMANVEKAFLSFGHEIKVENVARTMEEVEWCQCRPIEVRKDEYIFVRNPTKIMSLALGSAKFNVESPRYRRALCNTIGICESILNSGMPVTQEYACALIRNANTSRVTVASDALQMRVGREGIKHITKAWKPVAVTNEARLSFSRAFGIDVDRQLTMEANLREWCFSFSGTEWLLPDYSPLDWSLANAHSREVQL